MIFPASILIIATVVAADTAGDYESVHDPIMISSGASAASRLDYTLPLPNNFFTVEDPDTPTGRRVKFHKSASPPTRIPGFPKLDITRWNGHDGFSASSFICFAGLPDEILMIWSGVERRSSDGNFEQQSPDIEQAFVDQYGFASHMNVHRSLEQDSPSILMNAETGELIPHWIEEDMSYLSSPLLPPSNTQDSSDDESQQKMRAMLGDETYDYIKKFPIPQYRSQKEPQTIMVVPYQRLNSSSTYIVAFRNLYTKTNAGSVARVSAPYGFQVIRDDRDTTDPALIARKKYFEKNGILEKLEQHLGVERSDLVLAWDFTTASLISSTEGLRYMRDEAFDLVHQDGYKYKITKVEDNYAKIIFRKVEGTIRVPLYLSTTARSLKARFKRNKNPQTYSEEFQPKQNGWTDVPFIVWIPQSLANPSQSGRGSLMQFGHGLFSSREEPEKVFMMEMANVNQYVIATTDWWGLQKPDLKMIAETLITDISGFEAVAHRISQGILNQLVLMRYLRYSNMINDPKVFTVGDHCVLETQPSQMPGIAEEVKYPLYYGISLGGILGTVYMSLSEDVKVAGMNVPGGPFSLLFQRNPAGNLIMEQLLSVSVPGAPNRLTVLVLLNEFWDQCDPTAFAPALKDGGVFGKNPGEISLSSPGYRGLKKLAYQLTTGDGQVSGLTGSFLVRSVGSGTFVDDPYEYSYKVGKSSRFIRTYDRYITLDDGTLFDKFSMMPVVNPNHYDMSYYTHHVSTIFNYGIQPRVQFTNVAFSVFELLAFDTHELPRIDSHAIIQLQDYFNIFLVESRRGRFDDDRIWLFPACKSGCWNLTIPDSSRMNKPKRKLILLQDN